MTPSRPHGKDFRIEALEALITLEFAWQPWRLRNANVVDKKTTITGHFLVVVFDTDMDGQSREGRLRVSKRLYKEVLIGESLLVYCRYSRHEERRWRAFHRSNVRVRIAK
jgi:hypothetical protein